jgi:hypothetical protein
MQKNEVVFVCDTCLVEFAITVEPSYDENTVKKQFPESIKWLTKVSECPVCECKLIRK